MKKPINYFLILAIIAGIYLIFKCNFAIFPTIVLVTMIGGSVAFLVNNLKK